MKGWVNLGATQWFCTGSLDWGSSKIKWQQWDSNSQPQIRTICMVHLPVFFLSCHIQTDSTFYSCLNVKELLAWNRHNTWSLSDSNGNSLCVDLPLQIDFARKMVKIETFSMLLISHLMKDLQNITVPFYLVIYFHETVFNE